MDPSKTGVTANAASAKEQEPLIRTNRNSLGNLNAVMEDDETTMDCKSIEFVANGSDQSSETSSNRLTESEVKSNQDEQKLDINNFNVPSKNDLKKPMANTKDSVKLVDNTAGTNSKIVENIETVRSLPGDLGSSIANTVPTRRIPHLHKLEKKHSSGDLHSRLKTRKLLGVGETDDGDVHRSKLSQILGHSDQLYTKLPNGLRVWQITLATLFSVLSFWAMLFPTNFVTVLYDMDITNSTYFIRVYACSLICIAVMYWSTIQTTDRDAIRMVLLSSVVFFATHTCMVVGGILISVFSMSRWTVCIITVQGVFILIGYYFHCCIVGPRTGSIKRTTSCKELTDKDQ